MDKEKTVSSETKIKKPAAKKETKPKAEMKKNAAAASRIDAEKEALKEKKARRYFEAVGRRKRAIARVRLFTIKPFEEDEGKITVNEKFYKIYFPIMDLQQSVEAPLRKLKSLNRFEVVARVQGGGARGQAEAVRHGLARTLVAFNADFRKKLKKAQYLKRDPRVKERKKYGLKKARRAPQWSKR